MGGHAECNCFRSYLFCLSALGFAPSPAPLAPIGHGQAPSPLHLMGGLPHFPLRAAHRFFCQQRNRALKKEVMVRLCWSHNHKTLYQWLHFSTIFCIFFILFSITHWTRMQWKSLRFNFCHRGWVRRAELYLKPRNIRVEVNRAKWNYHFSAEIAEDYYHCYGFYFYLPGGSDLSR